MKKAWSAAEKWLFVSPLALVLLAGVVWNVQRKRLESLPVIIDIARSTSIRDITFSPDSRQLVVSLSTPRSWLGSARVYDAITGQPISDLAMPFVPSMPVGRAFFVEMRKPSWSPDGTRIAMLYRDGTSGTFVIPRKEYEIGSGVPAIRYNELSKFAIWNAKSGALQGSYLYAPPEEETGNSDIEFSKDGKTLIGTGTPVSLFDAQTGRRTQVVKDEVAMAPYQGWNQKWASLKFKAGWPLSQFVDRKSGRVLWSAKTNSISEWAHNDEVLAVIAKGRMQGISDKDEKEDQVKLWHNKTRTWLPSPPSSHQHEIVEVHLNRDGHTLLYNLNHYVGNESELVIWDYHLNRVVWRLKLPSRSANPRWSPDGQWFSVNTVETPVSRLLIFDRTGKQRFDLEASWPSPSWSPDSRRIAFLQRTPDGRWQVRINAVNTKS